MECNKDEAGKALGIAEKKLSENDYVGAKRFVENAQTLYPKLNGLEQMSMIIHVFISAASNKINIGGGEETDCDWYGILGVDPLADEEAVKKQYKKLVLLLHPDKNKFKGAEDAFKLVLEAWSMLSDKAKRTAYDQKRTWNEVKTGMQKPPNPQKPAASSNGNQNAGDGVDPSANATSHKPAPGPASKGGGYFWTMCNGCVSLCEYLRDRYLNKVIRCPNCGHTFTATEHNLWENIMREVDLRLSLLRQEATNKNTNTNGASSFGTTQKPANAYKPASSNLNQNASHGVDPTAYTTSNKHAPVNLSIQSKEYFWTVCNECKSLCEYLKDYYLNKAIRCPNCDQTFIATDNSFWENIKREIEFRLSLIRQGQQQQQQQQGSAQNTTNGGTYYPSSSRSFHRNFNATNQTLDILKRILDKLDEALAALERVPNS